MGRVTTPQSQSIARTDTSVVLKYLCVFFYLVYDVARTDTSVVLKFCGLWQIPRDGLARTDTSADK